MIADHFSRMPRSNDRASPAVGKKNATSADDSDINSNSTFLDNHHAWIDDLRCYNCIIEEDCFLNPPFDLDDHSPVDSETVQEEQASDNALQARTNKCPELTESYSH